MGLGCTMQYRHLLLAGLCTQAGIVHGMGLGEMELLSHLGTPLQAELELLSPAQLDPQEIHIRIARSDVYNRLGARFDTFHNQIEFDVRRNANGQISIHAYSKKRVLEPFLDIVVELSWPTGTTYRRYNLLVDPPAYAMRWQKADSKSKVKPVESAAMQIAQRNKSEHPRSVISSGDGDTYVVRSGDSLWKIAKRLRPEGDHSVHEVMQWVYTANPDAFIKGDRNRLKLGASLRLPAALEAIEPQQQIADYSQRATTPVAVTAANTVMTTVPHRDGLDIQAALQNAQQAQAASVPDSVAEIQAAIARLQQEKAELKAFQMQLKAEMADVLNERVAATEALLQAERAQRDMMLNKSAKAPVAVAEPSTPVVEPAIDVTVAPVAEPVVALPSVADPAPSVAALSDVRFRDLIGEDSEPSHQLEMSAALASQDLLHPTPRISNRLIGSGGSGLWYLLAMVPLGILVVLMGMRSHRVQQIRRSEQVKDEDLHDLVFGSRRDRTRSESPEKIRQALSQIREKVDHNERQRQEQHTAESMEARDDLKQMIDLYLLYSQYQKALNVILTEITKRPGRPDLRLYLMQVYAEMGDWKAFEEQEEVLRRLGQLQLLEQSRQFRKQNNE